MAIGSKAATEEVKEWYEFPDLAELEFDTKVREYREAHLAEAAAKAKKDALKIEIEAAMLIADQKRLAVGALIAIRSNGSSPSKIDKHQLLSAGVDADVIKACTIPGVKYTYIQVKMKGEKEEFSEDRD